MTYCQMPNANCPSQATVRIRIAPAGDRSLCAEHIAVLERMGASFRRLDEHVSLPAWRQRDLSRDLTDRRTA